MSSISNVNFREYLKKPSNLIELLIIPYFFGPIIINIWLPGAFQFNMQGIESSSLLVIIFSIIGYSYVIGVKKYNIRDFQIIVSFRVILAVLATSNIIQLFYTLIAIAGDENMGSLFIIPILYYFSVLGAILVNILGSSKNYTKQINVLSDKIRGGNYTNKIKHKQFLSDSIFASFGLLVNEVINTSSLLLKDLNRSVGNVTTSSEVLASSIEEMTSSSGEVASTSQQMSEAANSQAESVSFVVDKIEKVSRDINEIVSRIQSNSDVVGQIALQTNILALNAGIEASRAGDYGRGFAVVAENVRKLSDESKHIAEEISSVTNQISQTLKEEFEELLLPVREIAALSEETAASSEEVAAAAEEMSSTIDHIATTVDDLLSSSIESKTMLSNYKYTEEENDLVFK